MAEAGATLHCLGTELIAMFMHSIMHTEHKELRLSTLYVGADTAYSSV